MIFECMLASLNTKLTTDKNYINKIAGPVIVRPARTNCTIVVFSPVYGHPWAGWGEGDGYSGTEGAAPALCISWKKGSFFRPPQFHDFVKEGYFFCTQVRSMGGKNPLTIHEIYAALTSSDSLSYWASEYDTTTRAEDYKI